MELIHANKDFEDIRAIKAFRQFDAQLFLKNDSGISKGELSDYQLVISDKEWLGLSIERPIQKGDILYIPGTEWGGFVDRIRVNGRKVEVFGKNWREYLNKNIIVPPTGQRHYSFSGRTSDLISDLTLGYFDVFEIPESALRIDHNFRYQYIGKGLEWAFAAHAYKLHIEQQSFDNQANKVILSAKLINDYSDQYQFDADLGVYLVVDDDSSLAVNHLIGLGSGEGAGRMVINWHLVSGRWIEGSRPRSIDTVSQVIDYPSAMTEDDLRQTMHDVAKDVITTTNVRVDLGSLDIPIELDLGDVVSGKDELLGITKKVTITEKVLNWQDIPKITYKAE